MTPKPSATPTYTIEQLGGAWIIRSARDGSVIALRPDQESAEECVRLLEEKGTLA